MAKLWGEGVTQQNISDAMQKIGVSREKRLMGLENDDLKRHAFQARLKTKA